MGWGINIIWLPASLADIQTRDHRHGIGTKLKCADRSLNPVILKGVPLVFCWICSTSGCGFGVISLLFILTAPNGINQKTGANILLQTCLHDV